MRCMFCGVIAEGSCFSLRRCMRVSGVSSWTFAHSISDAKSRSRERSVLMRRRFAASVMSAALFCTMEGKVPPTTCGQK